MKKILIILCFAIGFSTLNAQVVKSSSEKTVVKRTEKKPAKKPSNWHIKLGLGGCKFTGSEDELEAIRGYRNTVYKFDVGFRKPFIELSNGKINLAPYWGMDFSLGNRTVDYAHYFATFTAHNLQWSPNVGLDIALSRYFSFDLHIGPYVSYDYSVDYDEEHYYSDDNGLDLGINMGFGFWINRVELEFCFQKGFTFTRLDNEGEGDVFGGKTNILLLKLGYRLPNFGKMKFHKVN
jgi:hypothetical protein